MSEIRVPGQDNAEYVTSLPSDPDNDGEGTYRLTNLQKLYHVPIFALRDLLEQRDPGNKLGHLGQAELIATADRMSMVTEQDIEDLYEHYRYGRYLSFYLYLLPEGLTRPQSGEIQEVLDRVVISDERDLLEEIYAGADFSTETAPHKILLLDEEELNGVHEIRFLYHVTHRFLNAQEQADQVLETRYGFLWLDLDLGYLVILSRDERVNNLLTKALTKALHALPLPVHFSQEVIDRHFSIEKAKRLAYYDPGTGVRRSISGQKLWDKYEDEIIARERQYARPGSLYDEEVADGIISGLGVTSSKGKIYLTKMLPTSLIRTWARQRLPDLVSDVKAQQASRPESFSQSIESINRMRLRATGKAAVIVMIDALLESDRERLTSVELPMTAMEIYEALAGKYFSPYLRAPCGECDDMAELCPYCESPRIDIDGQRAICKDCDSTLNTNGSVVLACMKGHVTTSPLEQAWSIAPNHWFQKRVVRIFAEVSQLWNEKGDYFHIEGKILYRLKREDRFPGMLPQLVQNYINNYWDPVNGVIHTGSGDIVQPVAAESEKLDVSRSLLEGGEIPNGAHIKTYRTFDLRIRGSQAASYTVEAALSGGGSVGAQPLVLPTNPSFQNRLVAIGNRSSANGDIRAVGTVLFNALFPTRIHKLWTRAIGSLKDHEGLRLTLHIDPPELMALPWEMVFDDEFLGLRLRFPIVRYLDLPDAPRPLVAQLPLRILVAVAEPRDAQDLAVDAELANIRRAVAQLPGKVEIDVLQPTRRTDLLSTLRRGYHVLHYIGHGVFYNGEGYLALEDNERYADQVSASLLGQLVADSSLRLIVLNSCQTSTTSLDDVFAGMAHQLVRSGLPAVVAMQLSITDRAAIAFSREFYGALADSWPVDAAVQEGRRGIVSVYGNNWEQIVDWAIPTLYMRSPNGAILGIAEKAEGQGAQNAASQRQPESTHSTTHFHAPVIGPIHSGSGPLSLSPSPYNLGSTSMETLFEQLYQHVEGNISTKKKKAALEQVEVLAETFQREKPSLSRIQTALDWFKSNAPHLIGAVVSVLLNPLTDKATRTTRSQTVISPPGSQMTGQNQVQPRK